jgi:hypothetical protein
MGRPLTEEQLIEGLLAALVLHDEDRVITLNDEHHRRFAAAVKALRLAQQKGEIGAADMPRALHPNPVSGRYRELDAALGRLQSGGLLGANNPLYPSVALNAGPRTAKALLERFFTPEQTEILEQLAEAYVNAPAAA